MESFKHWYARPHTLFLWIALVFGVANVVLNPPFMGVDEENHFARIIGFAQGRLFESATVSEGFAMQVRKETARMRNFFGHEGRVGGRDFFHDQNNKFDFNDMYHDLLKKAPAETGGGAVAFYPYNRAVIYPPAAYLSALPFAWLGLKAGLNPLAILYLVRVSIFLASTLLIYCAIRITPYLKWQMFLLALLQTSVFIRSGANADPHVFGYAFLFSALMFYALQSPDTLQTKNMWALAVLAALLCVSKTAYLLLPGMFFLLDGTKFLSIKHRILSLFLIVILPILLGVLWSRAAGVHYHAIPVGANGYMLRAPGVDERAQILFCMTHPFTFLHTLLHTFATLWPLYMGQLIAMQGDSQVDMSLPFGLLSIAVLLFPMLAFSPALNSDGRNFRISLQRRSLCLALFVTSALLICIMMYAGNSPIGSAEITGLQGRYFFPLLPLLLFAAQQSLTKKINTAICAAITVYVTAILAYSVYSLITNDYIIH